jgi:hypothetical protein
VLHLRSATAASAALICVAALAGPASAQRSQGTVATVRMPAGLAAHLAGGQAPAPGRAHSLYDLVRHTYESPSARGTGRIGPDIEAQAAHLEQAAAGAGLATGTNGGNGHDFDTVPLPLPPDVWIDAVFGGRTTPQTLVPDILRSRDAALFYYGLFWLDDETRAWLAKERALVTFIAGDHASRFTLVAPAFRVSSGAVRPPGGDAALAGWESLVGARAAAPPDFLRALLGRDDGHLAYFFGAMGQVSDARLRLGLDLAAGPERRLAAVARLYRVFHRLAHRWTVDAAPFWRPTLDPALLLSDLATDEAGSPRLPGTTEFWRQVLENDEPSRDAGPRDEVRALAQGEPIDFPTLCELLSRRDEAFYQRAHRQVLFASRLVGRVTPESVRDAMDAIRAAGSQPALAGTLERAGVRSVPLFARASRRAADLSRIGAADRATRSLGQFQGALFILARAALRGSLPHAAFEEAVESLVAVPIGTGGDYEGRLVPWLAGVLDARPARVPAPSPSAPASACQDPLGGETLDDAPPDDRVLRLLAGEWPDCPVIEWEGTRYRVDLAWAEGTRLLRLLGEGRRPYLAAAGEAVRIADILSAPAPAADDLRRQAAALDTLAAAARWEPEIRAALQDAAVGLTPRTASRTAAALRLVADDLTARGLAAYVYAASLGQPDRVMVTASEAAARHDFGFRRPGTDEGSSEWRLPVPNTVGGRDWRMSGSLLGMDVGLAEFTLVSVSVRPPSRAPTMNERERRAFVDAVALTEPAALEDAKARFIVTAMRRGRTRVAAIRTVEEAAALADEVGFSQARRTLLSWTVDHDQEHVAAAFAPVELFWLGCEDAPPTGRLDAWGSPAAPRTGCLCLTLDAPRPWEVLTGRWGMLASAFPDLKLTLAGLLVELELPAPLLAPVLAAATLDFVNTANPRGRHDRRALEAYVQRLGVEQLEQYLALLTTGGPLVPMDGEVAHGGGDADTVGHRRDETLASSQAGPCGARP